MTEPLHLVQVPVDLAALAHFSFDRHRGVISRRNRQGREVEAGFDEGRALHHLLAETFGRGVLQPFRLMASPGARRGAIYAYAQQDHQALRQIVKETGLPEAAHILDLDRMASKTMPAEWQKDRRLAFDLRVRPVVRLMKPLANPRDPGRPYNKGAELDAFLVEANRQHPDARPVMTEGRPTPSGMQIAERTREAVYRDWLAARMNGAELVAEATRLKSYERSRTSRTGGGPEGPDAILHGELIVTDPAAFAALLAHGVGRHKAYGYGMLLLRPASRRPPLER
jgi:CRISPR system Cascade subunit CasE